MEKLQGVVGWKEEGSLFLRAGKMMINYPQHHPQSGYNQENEKCPGDKPVGQEGKGWDQGPAAKTKSDILPQSEGDWGPSIVTICLRLPGLNHEENNRDQSILSVYGFNAVSRPTLTWRNYKEDNH